MEVDLSNFKLKNSEPISWCSLSNGDIILKFWKKNKLVMIGRKCVNKESLFNESCAASDFGIYIVRDLA